MLRGKHYGIDANGSTGTVITKGQLAFRIRPQKRQRAASGFGLLLNQTMRVDNWRGHQHICLVCRVAKHQTLIASTLFMIGGFVDAHGDVLALLPERV